MSEAKTMVIVSMMGQIAELKKENEELEKAKRKAIASFTIFSSIIEDNLSKPFLEIIGKRFKNEFEEWNKSEVEE